MDGNAPSNSSQGSFQIFILLQDIRHLPVALSIKNSLIQQVRHGMSFEENRAMLKFGKIFITVGITVLSGAQASECTNDPATLPVDPIQVYSLEQSLKSAPLSIKAKELKGHLLACVSDVISGGIGGVEGLEYAMSTLEGLHTDSSENQLKTLDESCEHFSRFNDKKERITPEKFEELYSKPEFRRRYLALSENTIAFLERQILVETQCDGWNLSLSLGGGIASSRGAGLSDCISTTGHAWLRYSRDHGKGAGLGGSLQFEAGKTSLFNDPSSGKQKFHRSIAALGIADSRSDFDRYNDEPSQIRGLGIGLGIVETHGTRKNYRVIPYPRLYNTLIQLYDDASHPRFSVRQGIAETEYAQDHVGHLRMVSSAPKKLPHCSAMTTKTQPALQPLIDRNSSVVPAPASESGSAPLR
jgi:hypothetical protein